MGIAIVEILFGTILQIQELIMEMGVAVLFAIIVIKKIRNKSTKIIER